MADFPSAPLHLRELFLAYGTTERDVSIRVLVEGGLCPDVYAQLLDEYSIMMTPSECLAAFERAGSTFVNEKGKLQKQEYQSFLRNISHRDFSFRDFNSLPICVREVFDDFAIGRAVEGEESHLVQFCERSLLAVKVSALSNGIATTKDRKLQEETPPPTPGVSTSNTASPSPATSSGSTSSLDSENTPSPTVASTAGTSRGGADDTLRPTSVSTTESTPLEPNTASSIALQNNDVTLSPSSVASVAGTATTQSVGATSIPTQDSHSDESVPTLQPTVVIPGTQLPTVRGIQPTGVPTVALTLAPVPRTFPPTAEGGGSTLIPTIEATQTGIPTAGSGGGTLTPTMEATGLPSMKNPDVYAPTMGTIQTGVPTSSSDSSETTFIPTLGTTLGSSAGSTFLPTIMNTYESTGSEVSAGPTPKSSSVADAPTFSPTILETTVAPTMRPTVSTLSLKAFNTCKIGMIVSDINRNDKLEPGEFVRLVFRLAGDATSTPPLFKDLDPLYQKAYNKLSELAGGEEPHLEGTKPGRVATSEQRENILQICRKTYDAIEMFQSVGPTETTDTSSTDVGKDDPDNISDEFKRQCMTAIIFADLDRDNMMDHEEFVRFANRLSPDIFHRSSAFRQLDPIFQETYENIATAQGITVSGSKPGQTSTTSQRQHLDSICYAANTAIRTIERNGGVSTARPSPSPTKLPFQDDESFRTCVNAMLIADLDRDDVLGKSEFVRLLNRLTFSEFAGMTFEDLDPLLQLGFYKVADDKSSINVAGSKPGSSTNRATMLHLESVCTSVRTALISFDVMEARAPTPPISPVVAPVPTPFPSAAPFGSSSFVACKEQLLASDSDRNFLVSEVEFVQFVNTITSGSHLSFDELPIKFRSEYGAAIGSGESIDLGATNEHAFENLCYNIIRERDHVEIQDCRPSLFASDIDGNSRIDKEEYIFFLELYGDVGATSFEDLPYILKANWDWIILERDYVDIYGMDSEFESENIGHDLRLRFVCKRTADAISAELGGIKASSFDESCTEALSSTDENRDDFIDDNEFLKLVTVLSGSSSFGELFGGLPKSYRDAFDALKDPDLDMIDIETNSANGVCLELELSAIASRESEVFLDQCLGAIQLSNENQDGVLDEDEYIQFVYILAVTFGYTRNLPANLEFSNLSQVLQLNFDVLTKGEHMIEIPGWQLPNISLRVFDNFRWICQNTADVVKLVSSTDDSSTKGYNSFIISNEAGLDATQIQSSIEWEALKLAYTGLVQDQSALIKASSKRNLRGRWLAVDKVDESSIQLYQIDDTWCSSDLIETSSCQVVFGSFDLLISNEPEPEAIAEQYSLEIQNAIDEGALQLKLLVVAANTPVKIVKSSTPLQPVGAGIFLFDGTNEPTPAPIEEGGSMVLALIAGALVTIAIFGTCYYCFVFARHKKVMVSKRDPRQEESETYYPPDKTEKSLSVGNEFSVRDLDSPVKIKRDTKSSSFNQPNQTSGGKLNAFNTSSSESFSSGSSSGNSLSRSLSRSTENHSRSSFSKSSVDIYSEDRSSSAFQKDQVSTTSQSDRNFESSSSSLDVSKSSFEEFFDKNPAQENPHSSHSSSVEEIVQKLNTSCGPTEPMLLMDDSDHSSSPMKDSNKQNDGGETTAQYFSEEEGPKPNDSSRQDDDESSSFKDEQSNKSFTQTSISRDESIHSEHEEDVVMQSSPSRSSEALSTENGSVDEAYGDPDASVSSEESVRIGLEQDDNSNSHVGGSSMASGSESAARSEPPSENFDDDHNDDSFDESGGSYDEAETLVNSTMSMNSKDAYEAYEMYRPIVEDLVSQVVPDEIDNVDTMMEQFIGRERELIRTLKNMAGMDVSSGDDDEFDDDEFDDDDDGSSFYSDEEDQGSELSLQDDSASTASDRSSM